MTNDEIINTIKKLSYHVSILGDTIDIENNPIEHLIISKNWDESDLNEVYDIFEEWDKRIESGEKINKANFEHDFSSNLKISYQGLKTIVLAFYKSGQWTNVCEAYVDAFGDCPPTEYLSIMRREYR
ncbi:DUF1878 family protein [Gluconobacter cerinus]|uniref:DUF1878 family protein n=1 Tax=Gluconobacter cerinus TaxID=38307 RepID=UPI001C05A4B9|nr:DUF1878 family protein [Gluconobacter cerinus]